MKEEYGVNDIQVLEGLEAVRKRPGMYIGTTGVRGLHHLVWEIVDNSVDESLAGYCDDIEIIVNEDNSVTVKDDGRGMPTGIHPKTGISTVETIFTVLHAGGKFGGKGYKVSGGLHGVGASVVNALSSWLEVKVYRDGKIYHQRFENGGHPVKSLEVIGDCDENRTGTTVTFKPDPTIFEETTTFDYETLKTRSRELAFLNKGLRIILSDLRSGQKDEFLYNGGLVEYVKLLNVNKKVIHDDIVDVSGSEDDISIEVAMQYNDGYNSNVYSFTNNINTVEGGTHEDGVRLALSRVINNYARNNGFLKDKDDSLTQDDVKEGITMVISCKHPNPQFEGQTKTKLGNVEVRKIASNIFGAGFEKFLLENPDQAKVIMEKVLLASRARVAAKKARELTRRKGDLEITNFYGKLTDCKSKDPSESEIFLVEGDSAGGSAKKGRDYMTQAILPLRGKILNVEKARLDRALSNEEIRTIVTAFGTGIGEEFDLSKLRYDKIIIMTDADVDGAHISSLLLTFFFRFYPELIHNEHIYIAMAPLYRVGDGKNTKYLYSDEELEKYRSSHKKKFTIQRYKGLGEMDADQLFETTMSPEHRKLKKVTLEDGLVEANEITQVLMGTDVTPRRAYIEKNSKYATIDS